MKDDFIDVSSVFIERPTIKVTKHRNKAVVYDDSGDDIAYFPAEMSDEHIKEALKWMNHSYHKGIEVGDSQRAREIRRALKIPNYNQGYDED